MTFAQDLANLVASSGKKYTDPSIAANSIVLGFAYSLTPEGFPGAYNEKIAEQLKAVICDAARISNENDRPWIGMQWEIFDAIETGWENCGIDLLKIVPLSHVGAPPMFTKDDIVDADAIVKQLKFCYADALKINEGKQPSNPSTAAGRILAAKIAKLLCDVGYGDEQTGPAIFDTAMFDDIKLAQYFNRLLEQDQFHKEFFDSEGHPVVELHDLYRTNVGSVGVENRQLPSQEAKLGRFQKIRVNRFIIEAIFPSDKVLLRGKYLSTRGVLDQAIEVIEREGGRNIAYAFVYGHPEHSPRCRRQLIESAWAAGWDLKPKNVKDVNEGKESEWDWDANTAQMWCRSKQNWDDYERMGKARLD